MHPDNRYATKKPDFTLLATKYEDLKPFVTTRSDGFANIDWKDGDALRALTRAILKEDWDLDVSLPDDRLCPTIPNRLDYIHHLIDIHSWATADDKPLRVIDIGTGAVAIYPLLLHRLRPDAEIIATEKDEFPITHARTVLDHNGISSNSINLLKPKSDDILFPLLEDESCQVDMTMCNPPFFASLEEMEEGQAMKAERAHTAHTGSDAEMVVEGGDVGFISRMIEESIRIGLRCSWYTSLIGRYSSLAPLISKLSSLRINNYYILSIRPAKTVRWIIVWSFNNIRLPDSMTRPSNLAEAPSSFTRLLPPPNTVRHVVRPYQPVSDIKSAIISFLDRSLLLPSNAEAASDADIKLTATSNTWSRAARRKLAQSGGTSEGDKPVLLKATLKVLDGSVEMSWTYGRDRADFDGLWKSLLANTGLIHRGGKNGQVPDVSAGEKKRKATGQGTESSKIAKNTHEETPTIEPT